MSFKANSICTIEILKVSDLRSLEKDYVGLSDTLKKLNLELEIEEKCHFDFSRYKPENRLISPQVM
jgi:hypothetical protein